MLEIQGNIWDYHKNGEWIAITTNGMVNPRGECVMGRGVALQAKKKYPSLAKELGTHIKIAGNVPGYFGRYKIVSFPVKHNWADNADLELIKKSAQDIADVWEAWVLKNNIYITRPGCGNGRLKWTEVKPVLEDIFRTDHFVICDLSSDYW